MIEVPSPSSALIANNKTQLTQLTTIDHATSIKDTNYHVSSTFKPFQSNINRFLLFIFHFFTL